MYNLLLSSLSNIEIKYNTICNKLNVSTTLFDYNLLARELCMIFNEINNFKFYNIRVFVPFMNENEYFDIYDKIELLEEKVNITYNNIINIINIINIKNYFKYVRKLK